jgi:hypothetical protein
LPVVNSSGGRQRSVQDAVGLIEELGDPQRAFTAFSKRSERGWLVQSSVALATTHPELQGWPDQQSAQLAAMPLEVRLALEMAAHEETERRALEGELTALEAQWKDAEEIAAIADQITLPERISKRLERLTNGR